MLSITKILYNYVCEDKFEFENRRRNPYILAEPHLALTEQNFLLTEQNLSLTENS